MRLALLCGSSARSRFVANTLSAAHDVAGVFSEVGREWSLAKVRRNLRPRIAGSKLTRALRRCVLRSDADQDRLLFNGGAPHWTMEDRVHRVACVNDDHVARAIAALQVDALAVFGTSVLRNPNLFAPHRPILNLHGGISPDYRGADSVFWALYHEDWSNIGASVHFVTRRIDGGALVAHARPAIRQAVGEIALTCDVIRLGARVLREAFVRLERGEPLGVAQAGDGRLYQSHERTWAAERRVRRTIASHAQSNASLGERVEWFAPTVGVDPPRSTNVQEALACR